MNKSKKQASFVNIGSSSLLIIFLVLCLATFAVLSLSSAKSDYSFSQRLAAHKTAYYDASSQAERIVAQIDEILEQTANSMEVSASPENFLASPYLDAITASLDGAEMEGISLTCIRQNEAFLVSFQVPSGERQVLEVSLRIMDYTSHPYYYEIDAWKAVTTRDSEETPSLNLIPIEKSE